MSIENVYKGEIGEVLGARLLLNYFNIVTPPVVDDGVDFVCWLKGSLNCHPNFRVQVKTGEFKIKTSVLERWVKLVHRSPVILLKVIPRDLLRTEYKFLV